MKAVIGLLVSLVMLGSVVGFAAVTAALEESAGKSLFLENKCNLCHSIDSQGVAKMSEKMEGKDLSNIGNEVSGADYVKGWLLQTELKDGEKHKKKFTGTDEELENIVNWVLSLKAS